MNNNDALGFTEADLGMLEIEQPGVDGPSDDTLLRKAGMVASRGAEALAGLPGDIQQLLESASSGLIQYATGVDVSPAFEQAQLVGGRFPTSADIRETVGEATNYALEPRSEMQELAGNIAGDFATLAIPVKGKIPFARALATSIVGNVGSQAAKDLGFEEGGQAATKIGLMIMAGMLGKGRGVKAYTNNLYKQAESAVEQGATVSSRGIERNILKLEDMLSKGIDTPSKTAVRKVMTDMSQKIKDGEVLVEDLMAFNRDINEIAGDPALLERGRKFFNTLRGDVKKGLEEYGKTNADFMKYYSDANQAFAGLKYGDKIKSFVRGAVRSDKFPYAMVALGYESAIYPTAALKSAAGLAGAGAAVYGAEVVRRVATNPALRKHYLGVVNASLKGNRQALLRNMNLLDRALKKSIDEEPLEVLEVEESEQRVQPVAQENSQPEDRSILGRLFRPIIA